MTLTGLRLSEILPQPAVADWNKDGKVNGWDEWIELYNAGATPIDLYGWTLNNGKGGNQSYRVTGHRIIPAYSYLVLYRGTTGIDLNNRGDKLYLFNPQGRLVDSVTFGLIAPDASYSRDVRGAWHADWSPSPGRANIVPLLMPAPNHGRPVPE